MHLIDEVLNRDEFYEAPPILFDVGASGGLNPAWRRVAKHSVCVAFDPDEREMASTRRDSKVYKELHIYNRALSSEHEPVSEFFLTQSPPCSSLLAPNHTSLSEWEFADRFSVIRKQTIKTIHVNTVITELKLPRVDWFKTDSQGMDLRLFLSLGDDLVAKVLVAEFEPGIMDAYVGEDKLWQLMCSMDKRGFWMSDLAVKGSSRLKKCLVPEFSGIESKYMVHLLKTSPGWAEVCYLNSFVSENFSQRDCLLAWVFASIKQHHGFALSLAAHGRQRFADTVFDRLAKYSLNRMRISYLNLPACFSLLPRFLRKWRKLGSLHSVYAADIQRK